MTLQLFAANFSYTLEHNFAWQAQYLARLEGDPCCPAHCKWRFICDGWSLIFRGGAAWSFGDVAVSFVLAGTAFGHVGVSPFVAGAAH